MYAKSSDAIKIRDNYYYLDTVNLNIYISWLTESGYFSKSFLKLEENRWKFECESSLAERKEKGWVAESIPPCVYKGDIIFLTQDSGVVKDKLSNISFSTKKTSDTTAIVDYGVSKLYWKKEHAHGKFLV